MKRFLLFALTAGFLSPIAAKAETWITIYSDYNNIFWNIFWPEEAFQIDAETIFTENGFTYVKSRYKRLGRELTIQIECSKSRLLMRRTEKVVYPPPRWEIKKRGVWYYDKNQTFFKSLEGFRVYQNEDGTYKDPVAKQLADENNAILAYLCKK